MHIWFKLYGQQSQEDKTYMWQWWRLPFNCIDRHFEPMTLRHHFERLCLFRPFFHKESMLSKSNQFASLIPKKKREKKTQSSITSYKPKWSSFVVSFSFFVLLHWKKKNFSYTLHQYLFLWVIATYIRFCGLHCGKLWVEFCFWS